MSTHDLQPLLDFRSDIPEPDDNAVAHLYRLASGTSTRRRTSRRRPWMHRPRIVLATTATALAIAGGAGAVAYHYLDTSPGLSAGFSAFDRLPPVGSWPSSLGPETLALDHSAAYMDVSPEQFEHGLRLLQTDLTLGPGTTRGQGDLYAYIGSDGTGCVFLSGEGGSCLNAAYAPNFPGVLPQIFPGNPGQTPAVTALVADNVSSIKLNISGQSQDIPIVNNSIYADLTGVTPADTIALDATYTDGNTHVFPLLNPASQ